MTPDDLERQVDALRRRLETMREAELAKALARIPDNALATREALEALATALINKVLHAPTVKLREAAQGDAGERRITAVSELFALEDTRPAAPSSAAPPCVTALRPRAFVPAAAR